VSTEQMPLPDPQDTEKVNYLDYVLLHSDESHRLPLQFLYTNFDDFNTKFFSQVTGAKEKPLPHITLGDTPLHMFAATTPSTGWGAKDQITFETDLFLKPTHRDPNPRIIRRFPSPGTTKFVLDVLLHEMVHHHGMVIEQITEDGYESHGPRFTWHANRITPLMGLSERVVARRRGARDRGVPTSAYWPFCLRSEGYYEGDVSLDIPTSRLSRTTPKLRQSQPPIIIRARNNEEAILRMVLRMLEQERYVPLKQTARKMLDARMTPREPMWAAHEANPHDREGNQVATPTLEIDWLKHNSNTAMNFAESIVRDARFDLLLIFADALQEAGCENPILLDHCRQDREHSHNCWLVRLLTDTLRKARKS
jgi:hypothetical protein